jgi:tetratricopeptide (TPR) repeat protein
MVLASLSLAGTSILNLTVFECTVVLGQTATTASGKVQTKAIGAVTGQKVSQQPAEPQQVGAADAVFSEGVELYRQGTVESLKAAIAKFGEASRLYSVVGDRRGEGISLVSIGKIYDDLGEKQKALSSYNQALPIMKAVGDRSGEATTLTSIGLVYDNLGEKQKALSFYNQALPISKAVGDREGEATALNNTGMAQILHQLHQPPGN